MNKDKKIQASERDQIACLLASKTSLREIARKLGRAFSSIRDEVTRNRETSRVVRLILSRIQKFTNMFTRNLDVVGLRKKYQAD